MSATTATHKIDRVEDGFARVTTADGGTTLGYVSREKHGSGRTEVRWFASRLRGGRNPLGSGYTRAEAVEIILEHARRVGRI